MHHFQGSVTEGKVIARPGLRMLCVGGNALATYLGHRVKSSKGHNWRSPRDKTGGRGCASLSSSTTWHKKRARVCQQRTNSTTLPHPRTASASNAFQPTAEESTLHGEPNCWPKGSTHLFWHFPFLLYVSNKCEEDNWGKSSSSKPQLGKRKQQDFNMSTIQTQRNSSTSSYETLHFSRLVT